MPIPPEKNPQDHNCESHTATPGPDSLETHCFRLGGQVPLRYCLKPGQENPCPRIMDCWWQAIDIETFLRNYLPPQQFESFLETPKTIDRLEFILTLLDNLKKKKET